MFKLAGDIQNEITAKAQESLDMLQQQYRDKYDSIMTGGFVELLNETRTALINYYCQQYINPELPFYESLATGLTDEQKNTETEIKLLVNNKYNLYLDEMPNADRSLLQ